MDDKQKLALIHNWLTVTKNDGIEFPALETLLKISEPTIINYKLVESPESKPGEEVYNVQHINTMHICTVWNSIQGNGWRYYFLTDWSKDYYPTPQAAAEAMLKEVGYQGNYIA